MPIPKAGSALSRALRKAEELWGDPVVAKASAAGNRFGPKQSHLWHPEGAAYDEPGIELPQDIHDRITEELDRIQTSYPPPNGMGRAPSQKEVNEWRAEKSKPLWDEIKSYGPDYSKITLETLPQEAIDDYKAVRVEDLWEKLWNEHSGGNGAEEDLRIGAKALEEINGQPIDPQDVWKYMKGQPSYSGHVKRITKDLTPWEKAAPQFETGKPVTVSAYHGSPRPDITEFKNEFLGQNTGANSAKIGHFFSGNPATAESYVGDIAGDQPEYEKLTKVGDDAYAQFRDIFRKNPSTFSVKYGLPNTESETWYAFQRALGDPNSEFHKDAVNTLRQMSEKHEIPLGVPSQPTTYPSMINMKNPLVRDWEGGDYVEHSYSKFLREAKEKGHDSAILMNTYDGGPQDNIFVTFEPKRIRSWNAKFDPENIDKPDIMGNIDPKLLGTMGAGSAAALTAGALRSGTPDKGTIEAAKRPALGQIANLLRKGAKNPVAGAVLPLEGMANLADKYAYGDPRSFKDYFEANPL